MTPQSVVPPSEGNTWSGFANDFHQIILSSPDAQSIDAVYHPTGDPPGCEGTCVRVADLTGSADDIGGWSLPHRTSASNLEAFKLLARQAAVAARCPNRPDGWVFWLEGIRANGHIAPVEPRDFAVTTQEPGVVTRSTLHEDTIKNICFQSVRYANALARGAAALPRPPDGPVGELVSQPTTQAPAFANRAEWLRATMRAHHDGSTHVNPVKKQTGLDPKTVKKILDARPVHEAVLVRLAAGYNVARSAIPND